MAKTKVSIIPGPGRIAVLTLATNDGEWKSPGGLYIPATAKTEGHIGKVEAVSGPYIQDGKEYENDYAVGDVVIFGRYTGTEVRVGREGYIVLRESEVLCKIVEQDIPDEPAEATATA